MTLDEPDDILFTVVEQPAGVEAAGEAEAAAAKVR